MVIQIALPEDAQLANAIRGPYELPDADEQLVRDLDALVRCGLVELHQDRDGEWRAGPRGRGAYSPDMGE